MELNANTLLAYLIALCLVVALTYFLFRWIFSVKRQLWNQKQQISLLIKIAHKLGVKEDETSIIEQKNNSDQI